MAISVRYLFPTILALSDRQDRWGRILFIAGIGLMASDLFHHFVVLWLFTGSPQFDVVYPQG